MNMTLIKASAIWVLLIASQLAISAVPTGSLFNSYANGPNLITNTTTPNWTYKGAGIFTRAGFSLTNPGVDCIVTGNSCLFTVSDTVPKSIAITGPVGPISVELCLNGKGKQSCQRSTVAGNRFAYLANESNPVPYTLTLCLINTQTNILSGCVPTGNPFTNYLESVAVRPIGSQIYVSTDSGGLYLCDVNPSTGDVGNCNPMPTDGSFSGGDIIYGIQLNPEGTFFYFTTQSNQIYKCSVQQPDGQLTGCILENNAVFANNDIAFNPSGTYLYYTSNATGYGPIVKCTVDPVTGDLSQCASTGDGNYDVNPHGIAINPSGTFAYVSNYHVSNYASYIYYCAINKVNGELTNCTISPASCQGLAFLEGIAINSVGTTLYITSNLYGVYTAETLPTGQLASCVLQTNTPASISIALR